jgi:lipid A 3-O-deacylase
MIRPRIFILLLSLHCLLASCSTARADSTPIWRESAVDFETGLLAQVGHNTPIDYRLVPTQLAWRSPRVFGYDFAGGASLLLRHRVSALGTWVAEGPEHQYLGFMFSPCVEYWNAAQTRAIYTSAGGGLGWIDSQGVVGGQGRDLTLNWFAQLGVQQVLTDTLSLRVGAMFQHMSNGGATDPNPGIDALGVTLGCSWRF